MSRWRIAAYVGVTTLFGFIGPMAGEWVAKDAHKVYAPDSDVFEWIAWGKMIGLAAFIAISIFGIAIAEHDRRRK